jgi:hypothetical protein
MCPDTVSDFNDAQRLRLQKRPPPRNRAPAALHLDRRALARALLAAGARPREQDRTSQTATSNDLGPTRRCAALLRPPGRLSGGRRTSSRGRTGGSAPRTPRQECYPCARAEVLPMSRVAHPRVVGGCGWPGSRAVAGAKRAAELAVETIRVRRPPRKSGKVFGRVPWVTVGPIRPLVRGSYHDYPRGDGG